MILRGQLSTAEIYTIHALDQVLSSMALFMARTSDFTGGPSVARADYLWQPHLVRGTDFGGTFSEMTGPDPILLPTSRRGIARNRVWPRETLQYIHYNTSTYITIHAIDILGYT